MGVVVSISLTLRLAALGFALGIIVGLWAGIGAGRSGGDPAPVPPSPATVTTPPVNNEAAP
jgi:hypothetical protein